MNGITAPIRRDVREMISLGHVSYNEKTTVYMPESRSSPHVRPARPLILDLPASRM